MKGELICYHCNYCVLLVLLVCSCTVVNLITGITLWHMNVHMCKYACKILTGCLYPLSPLCNGGKFYLRWKINMFLFCCHTYETENFCWLFGKLAKGLVNHNHFEDGLLVYLFVAFTHADSSGT